MRAYNPADSVSPTNKLLGVTALGGGLFGGFASGAIAAGELCTLNEGGFIRRVSERLPLDAHVLTLQGLNPVAGPNQVTTDTLTNPNLHPHKLPTGTVVYVSGQYIYFVNPMANLMYRLDNGAVIRAWTVLPNGNIVTVWVTSAGSTYTVNAKIWKEDGSSPSNGAFTVGTTQLLGGNVFNATGNIFVVAKDQAFHVSWEQHLTSGGPTMTNYLQSMTLDGVARGPQVQKVTGSSPIIMAACKDSSVLVAEVANSFTPYISRFKDGVASWGPTLITTAAGGAVSYVAAGAQMVSGFQGLIELANGNWAVVCRNNATPTNGDVIVGSQAGAILNDYQQTGVYLDYTVGRTGSYTLTASALGFASVFAAGSGSAWGLYSNTFDNVGNVLSPLINYGGAGLYGSAPTVVTRPTGNGFVFQGTVANSNATFGVIDTAGTQLGALIAPTALANHFVCSTADGLVSHFSASNAGVFTTTYKINRCSILGVADAAAVDGGTITIKGAGTYKIPGSQPLAGTKSFDCRASVIPGCRGSVSGNFATLFGYT